MQPLPAVLFPHSVLSRAQLGKILSLFVPLRIFVPWQMPPPGVLARGLPAGLVEVLRPPADLDPGTDLRKALEGYFGWVQTHPDNSGLGFLKTGAEPDQGQDPVWMIRQHLRRGEADPSGREAGESFRHHLVLHLEHELEEQMDEADRILNRLRGSKSLLDGLTEDPEEARSIFKDLPGFDWGPETGRIDPYPVMAAWLGLFESLIEPGDLLISPDRRYVDFLTELWIEATDPPRTPPPVLRFSYPDLSGSPIERIAEIRREKLAGEAARELYTLLLEQAGRPDTDQGSLSRRAAELAAFHHEGPLEDKVILTAVFLPPLPETPGPSRLKTPPAEFLGRTLIFLEHER
ncbi:MAG: hypothetical protein ACQET7_04295 [Thermodesulfobacteriota bacterium]